MERKHTPGWSFKLKNAENGYIVREGDPSEGAMVCDVFMTYKPEIALDRARLIAAAPRMYDFIAFCAAAGNSEAKAILEEINGQS